MIIDCLNVQPTDTVIAVRMAQWKIWMAARGFQGELVDEPVRTYTHAIAAAYTVMSRRIEAGQARSTALLCTTEPAAAGAMRAMMDHGIQPGSDVAICTIDGEMRAAYHMPSLTALEAPDPKPYLGVAGGGFWETWGSPTGTFTGFRVDHTDSDTTSTLRLFDGGSSVASTTANADMTTGTRYTLSFDINPDGTFDNLTFVGTDYTRTSAPRTSPVCSPTTPSTSSAV